MYPPHEHAFYAWMIIISIVCCAIIVGALLDRYVLRRHAARNMQTRGYVVTKAAHNHRP